MVARLEKALRDTEFVLAVELASGVTFTAEIDLKNYTLVGIQVPAAFNTCDLGFTAASASGGTFQTVYDEDNKVVRVKDVVQGRTYGLPASIRDYIQPFRYIIITCVAQDANRVLTLILKR